MALATKCSLENLLHSLYSPDLAPLDFCLFPNLKTILYGLKQWKCHRCCWWVPGRKFLFWRDKQTGTTLEIVHRGNGILYWEIMAQFLLLVISKVQGLKTVDCPSYFLATKTKSQASWKTNKKIKMKIKSQAQFDWVYIWGIMKNATSLLHPHPLAVLSRTIFSHIIYESSSPSKYQNIN